MRLIVACPDCQRKYDARGQRIGARFRCHCGGVVTVRKPRGHTAAVVRCSSCGATREKGAKECSHCGADFTVHDQDLETICPNCLARVSDRARFCHHCAALLVAEEVAGESTKFRCPACGPRRTLTSRKLSDEQINVLECQKCGGFWVGLETFQVLLEHEAHAAKSASPSPPPARGEQSKTYRPCAVCGELMVRRNFGRHSGVIVDICGSHGIWFDTQELAHAIQWIRSGGLEDARLDMARLRSSTDRVRKRQAAPRPRPAEERPSAHMPLDPDDDGGNMPWAEIIAAAATALRLFFRHLV